MKRRHLLLGWVVGVALAAGLSGRAAESPARPKPAPAVNAATALAKAKQELNQNIAAINQILGNPALREVGLESLARQTGIAGGTLEETRRKTAMSFGDLAAACILAKSSGTSLEQIKTERRARSWADIALARKVGLAALNEKLKAVQTDVDKFIQKQEEDEMKREMSEQRRQARLRGEPVPPAPDGPAPLPDGPRRER